MSVSPTHVRDDSLTGAVPWACDVAKMLYRVILHSQAHAFRVISLKVIWGKWLQAVQHNKAPRPHTHHDWLVSVASAHGPGSPLQHLHPEWARPLPHLRRDSGR